MSKRVETYRTVHGMVLCRPSPAHVFWFKDKHNRRFEDPYKNKAHVTLKDHTVTIQPTNSDPSTKETYNLMQWKVIASFFFYDFASTWDAA
jgi:hypothetical protein